MFKISERVNFGIFLLLAIAENEAMSLRNVVKRWPFMSQGYLEEIAAALKKAGIIIGRKGRGGGYRLAQSEDSMTMFDVVRALEGISIVETTTHTKMRDPSTSSGHAFYGWCVSRRLWGKVQQELEKTLRGITLSELVEESKKFSVIASPAKQSHVRSPRPSASR